MVAGEQQQVAGVDGHAEVVDGAAGGGDGRRHHVAAVDNRRCADDEHHLRCRREHLAEHAGERSLAVLAAFFRAQAAAEALEAPADDPCRLVQHRVPAARKPRLHQGHLQGPKRRHPQRRLLARQDRLGLREARAVHRERDDLDGCQQLAPRDPGKGRQACHGHGLVDAVHGVQPCGIDDHQPVSPGEQVAAAGEGGSGADTVAGQRRCEPGGGLVLAHVVGLEPRHHHLGVAGVFERRHVRGAQDPALLEDGVGDPQAVGQNRAGAGVDGNGAEPHGAAPRRRIAVICARIEVAISPGDRAPMSRPTGPWSRARAASSKPAARRRSRRRAWVRRLPRQPI